MNYLKQESFALLVKGIKLVFRHDFDGWLAVHLIQFSLIQDKIKVEHIFGVERDISDILDTLDKEKTVS